MIQWDDQIGRTNNVRQHFLNICYVLDVLLFHIIISFNPHKFFFRFISVYFFKTKLKITTQNIWEECSAQSQLKALCNLQPEHHGPVIRNERFCHGSDRVWWPETALSCPVSPIMVLCMLPPGQWLASPSLRKWTASTDYKTSLFPSVLLIWPSGTSFPHTSNNILILCYLESSFSVVVIFNVNGHFVKYLGI